MTEPIPPVEPEVPETPPADPKPEALTPEQLRAALDEARRDAAKHRTRNKELEPLAKKAQELEDAQKSEAQRLTDQLAAAQRERDTATAEAMRVRIALAHKLDADDIDFLGSGSEEVLTDRAARLAAKNAAAKQPGPPIPGRPVEQLQSGAAPTEEEKPEEVIWRGLGFPPVPSDWK
jgi:phosphoenolpyruvate synthase/pyruvate phosphate dikinase